MSVGTVCFYDFERIRSIIIQLQEKGTIIVAACHNHDIYSLSAYLPGVIKVRHSSLCSDE